jgi:hypothetical protein
MDRKPNEHKLAKLFERADRKAADKSKFKLEPRGTRNEAFASKPHDYFRELLE